MRAAVAPLLPAIGSPATEPGSAAGQGSQARLFEGLLTLLDALGQERPVLLVIEDLHWADRSTRAALTFLARNLTSERVLVVASYRSDEVHRGHPLRPLLAELERDPHSRRILLSRSPATSSPSCWPTSSAPRRLPSLLERLWTRSGGNPLFGEELLAAGLDGRGAAPDTLRDALMLRVERLSEPAQELLRLVAVGERLDHPLLAEASELEPRALRDALREAVEAHILVAQDDAVYRFRHALLREAVEGDLLPGERSELHLTLARALELRAAEDADAQTTAAVAHHFAAGGDQPAALAAAVRAAAAAERVHAHGEAAGLLDRALELWDRVPDPEARAGADRVTLLTRASDAASALADPGRQLALLEAALADLGAQPDPRRAARILESIARAQRHLNRSEDGIATLERALALVERSGDEGDPSARAEVLAGLARAFMIVDRHTHAVARAREALEVAAAADMPLVEGHARNTLGFSLAMTGDVDEGAAELREAARIAREHDSFPDLAVAYINHAEMLHILGRSAEGRELAAEGRRAVDGLHPVGMMWLDVRLPSWPSKSANGTSPRPPSPPCSVDRHADAPGTPAAPRRAGRGRGDHAAASALLDELEPLGADSSEPQALGPLGVLVAEVRRREGDIEAARAAVETGSIGSSAAARTR